MASLLVTALLVPAALAGSETNPDLVDETGGAPAPLDVTKAWITSDAQWLYFQIKLVDLAQPSPIDGSHGYHYHYYIEFSLDNPTAGLNNVAHWVNAVIHYTDTVTTLGTKGYGPVGTTHSGSAAGWAATTNNVEIAPNPTADTLVIKVSRAPTDTLGNPIGTAPKIPAGTTVRNLKVTTSLTAEPYEYQNNILNPLVGGKPVQKDVTGLGRAYLIAS